MKRPYFEIDEKKAKEIATKVYDDFKGNFDHANIDIKSLTTLVRNNGDCNGYELAKELEDMISCNIDTLIVEQLDTISCYIDDAKKELNNKWIKDNNIKPLFKKGDEVIFGDKKVFIHEVREKEGNYTIPTERENVYQILDFEDVIGIK